MKVPSKKAKLIARLENESAIALNLCKESENRENVPFLNFEFSNLFFSSCMVLWRSMSTCLSSTARSTNWWK